MEGIQKQNFEKFNSPSEELDYLKNRIDSIEKQYEENRVESPPKEEVVDGVIGEYSALESEKVLAPEMHSMRESQDEIALDLKPEAHDEKMAELIHLLQTKGIHTTIGIVSKMDEPHLTDDFHRFLVAYIREGYDSYGLKDGTPEYKALHRILFEVAIPDNARDKNDNSLSELVSTMQQVYAGILSVADKQSVGEHLTLEIAKPIGRGDFSFYISVPGSKVDLFKKQIRSFFPEIELEEQTDDFNISNYSGESAGGYMLHETTPARMLKTIDDFDTDPIKSILNVLSDLDDETEGAAIQLIFKPIGGFYEKNYSKALKKLRDGGSDPKELHFKNTTLSKIYKGVTKVAKNTDDLIKQSSKKDDASDISPKSTDSVLIENVQDKIAHPIVSTNIRIATSAETTGRAENILYDAVSAFNQFKLPTGNNLKVEIISDKKKSRFFEEFSYRRFNSQYDVPLNLVEVATIFHFPAKSEQKNPQLKTSKTVTAPAPIDMPKEGGVLLGNNVHAGKEKSINMLPEDRLRHMYVIGQTGTGKTSLLKSMIVQDIKNGDGVCMIDPHGSDIDDILANIPEDRLDDVIYFDPAHAARPMGLNMLEYNRDFPEQKTFVVNELFSIFQKLYGGNPESMGPMFEQYFRNATQLVIEDPDTGNTLLDVSRVMTDATYRKLKISRCKNPIVVQFWTEIAEKAGGDAALENIVPYITSKFDVFLANDIMRPVIAQEKSSFDFRKIMDEKKILLVNLSKGRLGDINSSLIGLIIVGKILMAALSRVDKPSNELAPFYLYIDEFQNVTTDSISTILSEARKYKLGLHVAHQFIAQLNDDIKDAVFGNVGSMGIFRVGADDADYLESQLTPKFTSGDIMNIDNLNCYMKMLSQGVPKDPFSMKIIFAPKGKPEIVEDMKQYSYQKYGRDRNLVEAEIMKKYEKKKPVKTTIGLSGNRPKI